MAKFLDPHHHKATTYLQLAHTYACRMCVYYLYSTSCSSGLIWKSTDRPLSTIIIISLEKRRSMLPFLKGSIYTHSKEEHKERMVKEEEEGNNVTVDARAMTTERDEQESRRLVEP